MQDMQGPGAQDDDPRAGVREDLARRTAQILRSAPAAPDPRERERDKQITHECRYLMRLLADRRRSEGEMRRRLRERDVPADVAHEAMARIRRAGLVDDAAFACEWVEQRRARKGLADQALRLELESKLVADEDIDQALGRGAGSSEERVLSEEARCRDLARRRLETAMPALADASGPERARVVRRVDGYLRRRGYDAALIGRVVSSELLSVTGR
jgi:regulatory protein